MEREESSTCQPSPKEVVSGGEFKQLDMWDIDIETLILEDEGGESLFDSDEEDYRAHITASEWEGNDSFNKSNHSQKDIDPFTYSIRAWDDMKDAAGHHGEDDVNKHGVFANGCHGNQKQSLGSESDLESWDSQRSLGLSDTSEGSDIFTFIPPAECNTQPKSGIRVKIKRKHLRPLSGEPKEGQNTPNKHTHGLLLHPDMVYASVAEKVIEKYRTRANSDSGAKTARMTEHVESFKKSFIEKMAQRRRSLPAPSISNSFPRKLQPLESPPEVGKHNHRSQETLSVSPKEKPPLNSRSVGSLNVDPIQPRTLPSPNRDPPPWLTSQKALPESLSSKGLSPLNSPKGLSPLNSPHIGKRGRGKLTRVPSPSPPSTSSSDSLGAQYNRTRRRRSDVLPLPSWKA